VRARGEGRGRRSWRPGAREGRAAAVGLEANRRKKKGGGKEGGKKKKEKEKKKKKKREERK
jgi:hypothetical protein